jgi:hypothetical protein
MNNKITKRGTERSEKSAQTAGNEVDPEASAERGKAENAECWPSDDAGAQR